MHPVAALILKCEQLLNSLSLSSSLADLMNVICQIFNSISLPRPTGPPPAPALCQKANDVLAHFRKFFETELDKYLKMQCHN